MILDDLKNWRRYVPLHPGFAHAFKVLHSVDLVEREPGRYMLDNQRLALIIGKDQGLGRSGAQLEAHRRFIDIQLVISGDEKIGWRSISNCEQVRNAYSEEYDEMLFGDIIETWLKVPPGKFAIFFPEDAHAPLAGVGSLHKAVVKIAMDW